MTKKFSTLTLALILLVDFSGALLLMPQKADADITSNLWGWWELNDGSGESATDSSGNDRTGTINGGATWAAGQVGGALDLDGTSDYIDTPSYNPDGEGTVAMWFRGDSFGSGTKRFFGTNDNFEGLFDDASPAPFIGDICGSGEITIQSVSTFTQGTWYHLALTWDDTANVLTLYVNGSQDNQETAAIDCTGLTGNFFFGWRSGAPTDERFNGVLDEIRLYDRELTSGDVAELFAFTGEETPVRIIRLRGKVQIWGGTHFR